MSTIDHALALGAEGFHVFPLKIGASTPAHTGWQDEATSDPDTIRKLWGGREYNIGIFTGPAAQPLLVVDIDTKGGRDGWQAIMALELDGKELPSTRQHATKSGGRHFIYRVDKPVKQGANVLGDGVDIRSRGGYIVAPGSKFKAGKYEVLNDLPIAEAPQWLVDVCGPADESPPLASTKLSGIDPERALARSIEHLKGLEPVTEGARDDAAFRVAAQIKDFGLDANECEAVMLEHWKCEPMLELSELRHVIRSAYTYGKRPQGSDAPEAVFEPVEDEPDTEIGHPFAELNKQFACVVIKGDMRILYETTDFEGRETVDFWKESTFHKHLAEEKIQLEKGSVPITREWIKHPTRRKYEGLVFNPGREVDPRFYNLWRGFNYSPIPPEHASERARKAVDAWFDHIRRNVAQGDPQLEAWFLTFMAHLIQKPYEKPLVALVMKGAKGVGKNVAVERVGALFSHNFKVADDDRYLVGNFNSHLENCLFLVLDEAAWAGSKQVEGKLKGIITGKSHIIERKGLEAYSVDNLTRIAILGNEDYLVPATEDERRYAVFEVGDSDRNNRGFFREMLKGMEANGGEGYGLLLWRLQHFDLSAADIDEAPNTAGLANQKEAHLCPVHQWWRDSLEAGQIEGADFFEDWPTEMSTKNLREAFGRYARDRNIRERRPSAQQFNKLMRRVYPGWEYLETQPRLRTKLGRYHHNIPPLEQARAAMEHFLGRQ